ncbi:unnamed protein product [Lota lota]
MERCGDSRGPGPGAPSDTDPALAAAAANQSGDAGADMNGPGHRQLGMPLGISGPSCCQRAERMEVRQRGGAGRQTPGVDGVFRERWQQQKQHEKKYRAQSSPLSQDRSLVIRRGPSLCPIS